MPAVIPKKTRDDVYRFLFTEGVLCLKKNRMEKWEGKLGGQKFRCPVHSVWVLMNSFKSRGYVKEQFAWRHFYFFLNDEGVEYLRSYLHLAEAVVPNTQKKSQKEGDERQFERRPERAPGSGESRGRGRGGESRGRGAGRGRGGYGSDRAEYQGADSRPRGCFNCGQEGHRAADCTNEKVERPQGGDSRPRGCFNCGQEGHRAADCTNEKVERAEGGRGRGRGGAAGGRGRGCFNCGQDGHRAADCQNPKAEAPATVATEAAPAPATE